MKCFIYIAVLISLIISMTGTVGCGKKGEKVLAIVGERRLTTNDFERALRNLPENYKILAESYKGKHKILDNLIKKELLVIEAQRREYHKDSTLKKKISEVKSKTRKEMDKQIAGLRDQRDFIEQQVYENIMLNELNTHLKKEGLAGVNISQADIAEYYADYARKLKILNPAAKVPKQKTVAKQIKAILVEEKLIKQLEKQSSVEIKETLFREIYGDENKDVIIEDATQ
ncbi:SurA N-terminal domain-containing protein [bacterium]|nr:SurA N-terminal domain-containing protein [bacterium]